MAGPMTRDAFIWTDWSETAPDRSGRGTSVGRTAESAGALSAFATPMASTQATIATREGSAAAARPASTNESTSCTSCIATRRRLRSTMSASAPPRVARKRSGPSWAKKSKPTNVVECVSS